MDSAGNLGSFAGRKASQSTELPWRGGRPHSCPGTGGVGIGFRLGEMVWAVWLGIIMFRGSRSAAARTVRACFGARDVVRRDVARRLLRRQVLQTYGVACDEPHLN